MQKVVVIVNSGDNVIPRPLLEKLIEAAGADTWECIDLPTESRLTQRAADRARLCPACNALLEETSVYCDNCGTDTPRR